MKCEAQWHRRVSSILLLRASAQRLDCPVPNEQHMPSQHLEEVFRLDDQIELPLRYNIAPTQMFAAVGQTKEGARVASHSCARSWAQAT
jgi:hypothetical protein